MEARPQFWDTSSPLWEDANRYQRLLGKLIYVTVTRPDIVYAVSVLSYFMQEPRQVHWEGALRVLVHIKRALGRGLIYPRHSHLRIEAYSNAGYAGDKGDYKSTTGYCTYNGGNLVTWRSYVAYKPITLLCIFFMFIEMKFIHFYSCVMFAMNSMSMCKD